MDQRPPSKPLRLRYWDCRGRGEACRLLLADALGDPLSDSDAKEAAAAGGLVWVDDRMELASAREKWPEAKGDASISGLHGTLPMLEWDGVAINQTLACAIAIANAVGRAGPHSDPQTVQRGLSVAQLCYEDLSNNFGMALWGRPGKDASFINGRGWGTLDAGNKLAALEKTAAGLAPEIFFGGDAPGIGDVFALTAVDSLRYVCGERIACELLEPCPVIP